MLAMTILASAQTQQGYVKTKGRLGSNGLVIKGIRLSGTTVSVKGGNSVVSGKNGTFSLQIPSNSYYLENVQKQGYVLSDPDVLSKQYIQSKNPMVLVLEKPDERLEDKLEAMAKIRSTLQNQLIKSRAEIKALRDQNKLTKEEYGRKLHELASIQEKNDRLVNDMANRFSVIDYDQLDIFNARISDCILNGRLQEADSLLKTKGDINNRTMELRNLQDQYAKEEVELTKRLKTLKKKRELAHKEMEDIAQDCYSRYEIFNLQHQTDSAAYYLECRSNLDSTNVDWLNDLGYYLSEYSANYQKAMDVYQRAWILVKQTRGENSKDAVVALNNIAMVFHDMAKHNESIATYEKAIAIAKKGKIEDPRIVIKCLRNLGLVYSDIGDKDKSLQYYEESLASNGCTLSDTIYSYTNIAGFYFDRDENSKAIDYYMDALERNERLDDAPDLKVAQACYSGIAMAYANMDDFTSSIEYSKKAMDANRELYGDFHPNVALDYNNLATIYNRLSKYKDALDLLEKAIEIDSMLLGVWYPDVAIFYNNKATSYKGLGMYVIALDYYKRALEINEDFFGRYHTRVGTNLNNIGQAYEQMKDDSNALKYYLEAADVLKVVCGETHHKVSTCYNNIGSVYTSLHDFEKAEEYFKMALAIDIELFGEKHSNVAYCYNNLGSMYNEMGCYDKAAVFVEKTLPIVMNVYGTDHINVAVVYYNVGVLNKKQGNYQKALEMSEKACAIAVKILPPNHPTLKVLEKGIKEIKEKMRSVKN